MYYFVSWYRDKERRQGSTAAFPTAEAREHYVANLGEVLTIEMWEDDGWWY